MEISITDNYYKKRFALFKWRNESSLANKATLALFMALITGIMAQIIIPLPWTPVPITGQTFAVLMAGIFLGRYWGGISQVIYIALGVIGVPWFTGMTSGYGVFLGSTGGYLIGFILAALFLGHLTDKYVNARSFTPMLLLMLVANFALIYIPGLIGLGAWMYFATGSMPTIWSLLVMGLIPFIIGDLFKISGAAALTKAVTPKESYNE
ncbi:biotin transporter BioY [Methanobacterium oryzae]|uniref:biotin transporter BioY n=1 Tax=Methanobacterium oryzae TaxID=69540 RepID=UPI003D1BBA51